VIEIVDHQQTNVLHLYDSAISVSGEMRLPVRYQRIRTCCEWTQNVGGESFLETASPLNQVKRPKSCTEALCLGSILTSAEPLRPSL
jgi:hypothetical protein